MIRKYVLHFLAVLLGLFFIISGIGKLLDVGQFIGIVQHYNVPFVFAPLVIFLPPVEILVGLLVIFLQTRKSASIIAILLLFTFTSIYLYGYFSKSITECGCSGQFSIFDQSPFIILFRNVLLLAIALYIFVKEEAQTALLYAWQKMILLFILIITCIASGASSIEPLIEKKDERVGKSIYSTSLPNIIETNKDSTYLLFFYSMNCSKCWNVLSQVESFKKQNAVDTIIGFTFGNDTSVIKFEAYFKIDFKTRILSLEQFAAVTRETPTVFFIRNDSIVYIEKNKLSAPLFYGKYVILQKTNIPF